MNCTIGKVALIYSKAFENEMFLFSYHIRLIINIKSGFFSQKVSFGSNCFFSCNQKYSFQLPKLGL